MNKWFKMFAIIVIIIIAVIYEGHGHFDWHDFNHLVVHISVCAIVCELLHTLHRNDH